MSVQHTQLPLCLPQVNVIHTANPMEHASHMAAQPQFVHPEHRSFVDLSGHNLANPHPFAGRTVGPSPLLPRAQLLLRAAWLPGAVVQVPRGT